MMKFVVILLILLFVAALIAVRFRKQITMGIQMWKMIKGVRQAGRPQQEKQIKKQDDSVGNVPLVKCLKCGTWVPKTNALKLGASVYCSTTCVERSEVRV